MTASGRTRIDLDSIFRLTELADYIVPFTIRAVCDLGVADHLSAGPRTVEELAQATGTHAPSLYRALRALACKEIFTETSAGTFALTPMAELLRADHPLSLKDAYPLIPADVEAWGHLDHSVRTGQPAFEHAHGMGYWEYMRAHPDEAARFDRAQQAQTRLELRVLLRGYSWTGFETLVDVGGGNGAFLGGLLARHPGLRGTLFDQPQVVAQAPALLAQLGVTERCTVVGGDFFEQVPPQADAYMLKRILYGWHDEEALALLRAVRAAMRGDSRLLIIEPLDEPGATSDVASRYDLAMLVMKGCGARSQAHIGALCAEAGLRLAAVTPTLLFPVLEARPAL
jgi:hypothetical protein